MLSLGQSEYLLVDKLHFNIIGVFNEIFREFN
jgi:hypothetical protein